MGDASTLQLVRDRFSWGEEPWFEGFHDPAQRWNGWACPYFSRAEGLRLAEVCARLAGEDPDRSGEVVAWDEAGGVFKLSDPSQPDGVIAEVGPVAVGGQVLYPIGSWAWTWSEEGSPD